MKSTKLLHNEKGDIGAGTLIIFIALVLVAAVAAIVLISTTGVLQQKALKTSKDATTQVSSNINVVSILGDRDRGGVLAPNIQSFLIRIRPSVGTTSLDLSNLIVTLTDANTVIDLKYSSICCVPGTFGALQVIDADSSFSFDTPVINNGDLVEIEFHIPAFETSLLAPGQTMTISLNQETGSMSYIELNAPRSFGVNRFISLYP